MALAITCALAVLGNDILFSSVSAQQISGAGGGTGVGSAFELTFWQSVAGSEDRGQLEAYLAQYPNGTFSALARAKVAAIERRDAQAQGTPSAPVAVAPVAAAPIAAAPVAQAPAVPSSAAPNFPPASSAPVAAAPVAIAPVAAPQGEQLRALGRSQSQGPMAASAAAAASQTAALPVRPDLPMVPAVSLPDHFCSAVERNGFYDSVFTPSKERAELNNRTAIEHMGKLRQIYDDLAKSNNVPAMNVVAEEAKSYQTVAAQAYDASAAYEPLFNRMMAVPIRKC